ncbi:MAG: hypothetical protein MUD01_26690 [Chloroflexaceae bacterium]|jgi:hypothetical protein|nr:hypothetical protein [Chloroflexaceae bacterium]
MPKKKRTVAAPISSSIPIGRYLVMAGAVTEAQINAALAEQQHLLAEGQHIPLGDILVQREMISPENLADLLVVQLFDHLDSATHGSDQEYAASLLREGKISVAALEHALVRQTQLRGDGVPCTLEQAVREQLAVSS